MNTLTINPTSHAIYTGTMAVAAVMDELEYRNYVSHRIRDISFERMEMWKFWNNIEAMEERFQRDLDEEQAIEIYPEYNHSLRHENFSQFSLED